MLGHSYIAGEGGLAKLVECLDKAFTAYGIEISAKKTKMMTTPMACKRMRLHTGAVRTP